MKYVAARTLVWGDGNIAPGEPVPAGEPGRNYGLLERMGDIIAVEDDLCDDAESDLGADSEESDDDDEYVEIPDEWEQLGWPDMRALASRLTDDTIRTKNDAVDVIREELDRRGSV